ncbi:MAG: VOC family protein [Meiothermus sp.]|nr:VOC family protein [Meiothermus sp.]
MTRIDHLVVAARTLAEGVRYVEDALGVGMPQAGGKHPLMGTHNRLMSLGGGAYLEVIAPDPDAPDPGRPRWFDLDRFRQPPRLVTWVARADDLERHAALNLGTTHKASRGSLEWLIALPEDGRLHHGGAVPYLIQWGAAHPTDAMPDSRCRLEKLTAHASNPSEVEGIWRRLGLEDGRLECTEGSPGLAALIHTPGGPKLL